MNYIGKNIRKIRTFNKLTQTEFADLFEQKRANIGAWEEERAEPNTSTLMQIASRFRLSLDDFLGKELTVNDIAHFDVSHLSYASKPSLGDTVQNTSEQTMLRFVNEKYISTYTKNFTNPEYVNSLPEIAKMTNDSAERAFLFHGKYIKNGKKQFSENDIVFGKKIKIAKVNSSLYSQTVLLVKDDMHFGKIEWNEEGDFINCGATGYILKELKPTETELWLITGFYRKMRE